MVAPLLISISHERLDKSGVFAISQCIGIEAQIDIESSYMRHFFVF
ncbi:hypothetical protein [Mesorhizobium tianshanense]|nr:hypothetical protein [Mesorhizobium tianshanense]